MIDQAPIVVRDVSFSYGGGLVLNDVGFVVRPGEFMLLTGPNGAGKSTLAKLVLGEEAPVAGEVLLFGEDPRRFRSWKRVGYVPQRIAAAYDRFPAMVGEVVSANRYAITGPCRHERRTARSDAVARALAAVRMEGFARRPIGALSGGQFQRVLLARALVNDPELLVLDEPTSGLDERATEEFVELVSALRRDRNVAVLLVTHDLRRLSALDATTFRLEGGCVCRV